MSEKANLQIVKDVYDAFVRGDIDAVIDAMADDVEWEVPGPAEIPYAGLFRGKSGVADFFRILADSDDVLFFEAEMFFTHDDRVAVFGHYSARVKSTGREGHAEWAHSLVVRNGKVAKFREYYDTAKFAEAYHTETARV
jgi:ketosteroid isomerase-like protein